MAEITIEWNERRAIWWALKEDGMTAVELAKRIGMDPSKLSRIIGGGKKTLDVRDLSRIAAGQGRPLEYYTQPPIIHAPSSWPWGVRPIDVLAAA